MNHFAFIVSSPNLTRRFLSIKCQSISKVARHPRLKPIRTYNTRANKKKRMELFEENYELREEVSTLWTEMEKFTNLVYLLAVTQS